MKPDVNLSGKNHFHKHFDGKVKLLTLRRFIKSIR